MLGANGCNGGVWHHEWHGKFMQMKGSTEK